MNFILPTSIVKIIDFVSLDSDNNIIFTGEDNKYALCKTLDNNIILINFLSNQKKIILNEKILKEFFKKKSYKLLKEQHILKLSKQLQEDKEYSKKISSELTKQILKDNPEMETTDLMMEVINKLSNTLSEKSKEILLKDKLIQKNSIIRLPLSSNENKECFFKHLIIPIYDSYSILMNKSNEPLTSGLYLFSSNQQFLPLIFEKNKKNNYSILFNTNFSNKNNLLSLLFHSLRTFERTKSYIINIFIKDNILNDNIELKKIILDLNKCSKSESFLSENYKKTISNLISWVIDNADEKISIFQNSKIYLPKTLSLGFIYEDTLFSSLPTALANVSFRNILYSSKEDFISYINEKQKIFFNDKKIYGFYSILYDHPEKESDTYGFLDNNISKFQVMSGFNDTLKFFHLIMEENKENMKSDTVKNIEF